MRNCEKNGRDKRAIEVENNEEQTINTRPTRGAAHGASSGAWVRNHDVILTLILSWVLQFYMYESHSIISFL